MKTALSVILSILMTIVAQAQIPNLNSYRAAQQTIYLDFDGELVHGTAWNWFGDIVAQPAGLTTQGVTEIFNRVAEDYRIFNVNITTDSSVFFSTPINKRIRVIITPTFQWYGNAGGVAYIGSYVWGDDTPAWVFSTKLGKNIKYIAEAISHEAGHTLGLHHQSAYNTNCKKTAEYHGGQGTGEIGWAPIMGVGYYKNITTWHNGANSMGCNYLQNDINILATVVGLRTDEHADIHQQATPVTVTGVNFTADGMINTSADKDVFKFQIAGSNNFQLSAIPKNVGAGNSGANVDIKVALLNAKADTIGRYNPGNLLNAGVDTNLSAGTYYLVVDGVGNLNINDYGSVGFYSLIGNINGTLAMHRLLLTGKMNGDLHTLNWQYKGDEPIKEIELQSSKDGVVFSAFSNQNTDSKTFTWSSSDKSLTYYRVKVITVADERSFYSNIVLFNRAVNNKKISVINDMASSNVIVNVHTNCSYQLIGGMGYVVQQGQLLTGVNRIDISSLKRGILFLRIQFDNEVFTEKFIKP